MLHLPGPLNRLAAQLEDMDSRTLIRGVLGLLLIAAVALAGVFMLYVAHFGYGFLVERDAWGQFGDFFGGTLNPVLSFLGLIALVLTLALQSRQLELTKTEVEHSRLELEATRAELVKSSEAQQATATALAEQSRLASISARLNALNSALSATNALLVDLTPSSFKAQMLRKRQQEHYEEIMSISTSLAEESDGSR